MSILSTAVILLGTKYLRSSYSMCNVAGHFRPSEIIDRAFAFGFGFAFGPLKFQLGFCWAFGFGPPFVIRKPKYKYLE